jgi:parallel beta-helix repeat protein
VQVRFDGEYSIFVYGTLIAIGTETTLPAPQANRINITSNMATPARGDWKRIEIESTGHADIRYCDISYGEFSIYLNSSSNNTVAYNNIFSSSTSNIALRYSANNNILMGNNLSNVSGGCIDLAYSSNNNVIIGNNIFNKGGGGVTLDYSSENNMVSGNNIHSTMATGIRLEWSSNNTITNNNISSNWYAGIGLVFSSNNNTITNNNISDNGNVSNNEGGIFLASTSNNNIIRDNDIINSSGTGISILSLSINNKIYHNNIINNTVQAYDDTVKGNLWNDSYPSGGNYWSDWSPITPDLYNGSITPQTTGSPDGICDFQYDIDADSVDYYPLKNLVDTKPPTITNKQPPDGSTINESTPTLSANYSDPSGIDTSSVVLKVDGIDVTSSASVTANGVSYLPGMALADGIHTVYLEVKDNLGNLATAMWSFTVDTTPPIISDVTAIPDPQEVYEVVNISANITDKGQIYGVNVEIYDPDLNFFGNFSMLYDPVNGRYYWNQSYDILGTYTFTIYVNDTSDNWNSYSGSFVIQATMILKQGWNLISIPLIQEEKNLRKVLNSIDGLYDAVQRYDITDKNDHWKHHKVGKPFGNDLSEITEKMGFWIHITQPGDTIFYINGTRIFQNQTITLHEGWNLVGYPSRTGYNRTDGLNNLTFGDDVGSIWTYNASSQKWIELKENDYFELGRGYWIYSKDERIWEVPI